MKKLTIILAMLTATNLMYAQNWEWQNPRPQGNDLLSTCFVNSEVGFAVGDMGTIIKTTDGGVTWTIQESGTDVDLIPVFFVDENIGYTAGYSSHNSQKAFLKTTNGGNNWTETSTIPSGIKDIFFTSADTGFIVTAFYGPGPGQGYIKRTTDGGYTWETCCDTTEGFSSVYFPSKNVGYAAGGAIMKTIDGGSTWTSQNVPNSIHVSNVYFIDENIGFAVGAGGYPIGATLKTIDGGAIWIVQSTGQGYLSSVVFIDEMNGYGVSDFGAIKKTTNGGISWSNVDSGTDKDLRSILFTDSSTGYIVGNDGVILKSMDGGTTWVNQLEGPTQRLHSTYFTDGHTGYAVGGSGWILKTMDAGTNWLNMPSGTMNDLHSVFFIDTLTGYVAGSYGTILKTNDAGNSWTGLASGTSEDFNSIFFPSNTTGYVAGTHGTILKTIDGGGNWTSQVSGADVYNFTSAYFIDENRGYVVGIWDGWGSGIILSTNDGGTSWTSQSCIDYPKSIFFPDEDTGYIAGHSAISKTTNGGESWYELESILPYEGFYWQSVYFLNADEGYVVGAYPSPWDTDVCKIMKTLNGGGGETPWEEAWEEQNLACSEGLNSIFFATSDTGYVVGVNGSILRMITNSNPPVNINSLGTQQNILEIYPNPVSEISTIEFELKQPSVVSIQIFNNTGEKIHDLGNKIFLKGKNQVNWSTKNLPAGIYFCRIQIGNEMLTKKIIKIE